MYNEKHVGGFKYRNRRVGKEGKRSAIWILSLLSGAIVKDLRNENSLIKKFVQYLPGKIAGNKEIIDVKYEEITGENNE